MADGGCRNIYADGPAIRVTDIDKPAPARPPAKRSVTGEREKIDDFERLLLAVSSGAGLCWKPCAGSDLPRWCITVTISPRRISIPRFDDAVARQDTGERILGTRCRGGWSRRWIPSRGISTSRSRRLQGAAEPDTGLMACVAM